jgi:methylated-DNA-protein-cysteine methyltransferase-like protein
LIKHQSYNESPKAWRELVYDYVDQIPSGYVCTYGEIADYLGLTPRMVGSAMRECPNTLPWHRVIGSGGRISIAKRSPELAEQQIRMLNAEGIVVNNLRVDLPE